MVFTIVLWGYSLKNEGGGGGGFGVRVLEGVGVAELGLEIIGSQFLETHLERIRDPAGTRKSIRVSRSSLLATVSADDEETKTWADFFRIFLFFVSTLFFILTD